MITEQQLSAVIGSTAVGPDGKLGTVGEVYLDDETGRPEWATVRTGMFGTKESFVPLAQADLTGVVSGPTDAKVNRRFTISAGARNLGPSTADNLSFTVTFPSSFSIAKVTPPRGVTCTQSGQQFTCAVSSLGAKKAVSLKATGSFTAPGLAVTDVSVSPGTPGDPNAGNNTAQLQTNVT